MSFCGYVSTSCGHTQVSLSLHEARAELRVQSRWMGQEPLDVTLALRHAAIGSHSGALFVEAAFDAERRPLALPECDGEIIIEYARLDAPQPGGEAASLAAASASEWTDAWSLILWVHPYSYWDDGTQLAPEAYEVPPEQFALVVRVLRELERPWKLG